MNIEDFESDDIFNRKYIAKRLTNLTLEGNKPFSLAIDSFWGSGKTTFVKKWEIELMKEGHKTIFLDAWENDYYIDPIIPLIGVLEPLLKLNKPSQDDWKPALMTIIKHLTQTFTGFNIDNMVEDFQSISRENLITFNTLKEEKDLIIDSLSEISKEKKIYFFIDELDRCKPIFAINLLERIKHFLNIPNFVFIFSMDMTQLTASSEVIYGKIDSDTYFRKFFNIIYHLPSPKTEEYFKFMLKNYELSKLEDNILCSNLIELIKHTPKIGLRECEKIFELFLIYKNQILHTRNDIYNYLIPIITIIKIIFPEDYKSYISSQQNWNLEILEKIGFRLAYLTYDRSNKNVENTISYFKILGINNKNEREIHMKENQEKYKDVDFLAINYSKSLTRIALICFELTDFQL